MSTHGLDFPAGVSCSTMRSKSRCGVPAEIVALWLLFAGVCVEVLVAYTKTKPGELIGVPRTGLSVAVTDAIGFLAFPTGLIAVGVAIAIGNRLRGATAWIAAACAVAVAVAFIAPGIAESEEVEVVLNFPRVVAAVGVITLMALTFHAATADGIARFSPSRRGDFVRVAIAGTIVFGALPWFAADLTLSLDRVPGLSRVFLTDVLRSEPGRAGLNPAVHDGHHHGMDGALLALAAIAFSRLIGGLRRWRRVALAAVAGFLFAYGSANALQDFWLEQVVKRGASNFLFPKMMAPSLGVPFMLIVAAATLLTVLLLIVDSGSSQRPADAGAFAAADGPDGGRPDASGATPR